MSLVTGRWQWIASFNKYVEELNFDADGNLYALEANQLAAGGESATIIQIIVNVVIGGCDTGVPDMLFPDGSTISGGIEACAAAAENHGEFVNCVADFLNQVKEDNIIAAGDKAALMRCAAQADIP